MNTEEVKQVVDANQVVTLRADWTNGNPEIGDLISALSAGASAAESAKKADGGALPLYAIFSPDRPNRPIIMRELITKGQVVAALQEAGPSRSAALPGQPAPGVARN